MLSIRSNDAIIREELIISVHKLQQINVLVEQK